MCAGYHWNVFIMTELVCIMAGYETLHFDFQYIRFMYKGRSESNASYLFPWKLQ